MVRDGIYYGIACIAVAAAIFWMTGLVWLAAIPVLLAAFFLQFFRDPERQIPTAPGAVVSPGDGKVTDIAVMQEAQGTRTRISIFLNVFNVHVNRSPISGVITAVEYRRGKFRNAMDSVSAELNEQNICTVRGEDGLEVTFKQIAGLIARRIVFWMNEGDRVERGQRVGLIKFGSRVDVLLPRDSEVLVKLGDKVKGGSSVLATLSVRVGDSTRTPGTTTSGRAR